MRKRKKPGTKGSSKKATPLKVKRRQKRKKSAPSTVAEPAKHVDLPLVVAPPMQMVSSLSPLFWTALPIAMMRMWFEPRSSAAKVSEPS
jgi:hypothetical protein